MFDVFSYYQHQPGKDTAFVIESTKIKFGRGAQSEIAEDCKSLGMTKIAVFTDPQVAQSETFDKLLERLKKGKLNFEVYDRVAVEPTDVSFKQAIGFATAGEFDGYISLGGGSVMDTCKAANLYATYPGDFLNYVNAPIGHGKMIPGPIKPHIACPTTFGTASECTGLAIFDLLEMKAKTGIVGSRLKPSLGIVDPETLYSLPPLVIAANGFDVFSHSCESYTARPFTQRDAPEHPDKRPLSQGANPYSDMPCINAIRIVGDHLVRTVNDPSYKEGYEYLMFAGMLAGIGFGSVGCHIPHGMSYSVSGLVKEYQADGWPDLPLIPHGISVIVNSPAVFRATGPAAPQRHFEAATAMGVDMKDVDKKDAGAKLAEHIIEMMKQTNMPNGLSGVGYGEEDLDALTAGSFPQKRLLSNGPIEITESDQLKAIYADAISYW